MVPPFIGWIGIGTGITGVPYNVLFFVKHDFKALLAIGSLFGTSFELIFAGWLLFY